jgi:hypothetical protein
MYLFLQKIRSWKNLMKIKKPVNSVLLLISFYIPTMDKTLSLKWIPSQVYELILVYQGVKMSLKTHHCSLSASMISFSSWGLNPIRAGAYWILTKTPKFATSLQWEVKKPGTKHTVNEAKRTPTDASFYSCKQSIVISGKRPKLPHLMWPSPTCLGADLLLFCPGKHFS